MNQLEINHTMSSREIATMTGKEHRHVMRDIRSIEVNLDSPNLDSLWKSTFYTNSQGKQQPMYSLTKKGSLLLATKYNDNIRLKLIDRWEELEKQSAKPNLEVITKKDLAIMLLESEQEKEALLLENQRMKPRDEYIDKVFESSSLVQLSEAAKLLGLGIGRNTLYTVLREKKMIFQNSTEPIQYYVDRGYFVMKQELVQIPVGDTRVSKVISKTFVTQKGLAYIAKILNVITTN